MILTAIVILSVLATAYIWGARGFFSALIHMVCTIIAGAVAFSAWETVTNLFMGLGSGGFVDYAHGIGLALPFALTLIVLRLATNAILPKNVDLDGASNMIGGGVCGLIAGVLTAGIFVISLGYLRFESTLLGYEPFTFDNTGSLVRTNRLLLPADELTANVYSTLSATTLRTQENLAKWHPDLADEGPLLRMNFDDGKSRHVHKPGSIEVLGRYTVSAGAGVFNDTFEPNKRRSYKYTDNSVAPETQTTLEGYIVKFKPSANEKSGRVIVGNGQLRLIVEKPDGTYMGVQPAAAISEADPTTPGVGRWAFDAQKTFISTVGGRNEVPMAFEFPVPNGSRPIGLYVKGLRQRVDSEEFKPFATYPSAAARDGRIRSGDITRGSKVTPVKPDAQTVRRKGSQMAPDLIISDTIPFGKIFQKDDIGGLNVNSERRLTDGEGKFRDQDIKGRDAPPELQVRRILVPPDQVIVQVIVDGRNTDWGFISDVGQGIDPEGAPVLTDVSGTPYAPFGYAYQTGQETWISLRPDAPIAKVTDMPQLSRSKPNDRLVLLFRVGKDQKLKYFAVGEKALLEMEPPFETPKN